MKLQATNLYHQGRPILAAELEKVTVLNYFKALSQTSLQGLCKAAKILFR
jgi:hypothetical protein